MLVSVVLVTAATAAGNLTLFQRACWKNSVTRGVGKPISACAAGTELDGGLCYPVCTAGYKGVGPVCWETCPEGYADEGTTCHMPLKVVPSDNKACKWYDKCGLTLDKGCSTCPEGYANDGCTCRVPLDIKTKKSFGRTAGTPMVCADGLVEDTALCYPPCPGTNWYQGGPVCWEQCPASHPVKCGAICGKVGFNCSKKVTAFISAALKEVVACATGPSPACIAGIAELAVLFTLDGKCSSDH